MAFVKLMDLNQTDATIKIGLIIHLCQFATSLLKHAYVSCIRPKAQNAPLLGKPFFYSRSIGANNHRSTSPKTISIVPMIALTSANWCPLQM